MPKLIKDYNSINWSEHFYLDSESPSGLCWNRDVLAGRYKYVMINKGTPVGNLSRNGTKVKAWVARINSKPYLIHRIVWVMVYGSIDPSLLVDHLNGDASDNNIENLALKTTQGNAQNRFKSKNNRSGITGVRRHYNKGVDTFSASVIDSDNRRVSKSFSVAKYGSEEAFRLACEYRTAQIALLNENGANYTDRHGSA